MTSQSSTVQIGLTLLALCTLCTACTYTRILPQDGQPVSLTKSDTGALQAAWDRLDDQAAARSLDSLRSLVPAFEVDPVFLSIAAERSAARHEYEFALQLALRALALLDSSTVVTSEHNLELDARTLAEKKRDTTVPTEFDRAIVQELRRSIQTEDDGSSILRLLTSRPAYVPYPPSYPGSPGGLALEVIMDELPEIDYMLRPITYAELGDDPRSAREIAAVNVVILSTVSLNKGGLETSRRVLSRVQPHSRDARFFLALADYCLGSTEYAALLPFESRRLFQ